MKQNGHGFDTSDGPDKILSDMLNTDVTAQECENAARFYIDFAKYNALRIKELAFKMMISIIINATDRAKAKEYVEMIDTVRAVTMSATITGMCIGYVMGRRGTISEYPTELKEKQATDLSELLKSFTIPLDPTVPADGGQYE